LRFGYHVSVSGKPASAITNGIEAGCDCIQFFPSSPRQWRPNPATDEQAEEFRAAREAADIGPTVIHAIYLVNLAAADLQVHERSMTSLAAALQKADALGVEYVVTHTGNPGQGTEQEALERIAKAVDEVLAASRTAMLLLETTAGSGSSIGHTFEQFGRIMDEAGRPDRLGLCLDTSHVFAAGYDIRTSKGLKAALGEVDEFIGMDRLRVLHLNDSKSALGSKVDRHAHIGEGEIGTEAFKRIVRHPALRKLPGIIELPHGEDDPDDLALLRSLTN